MDGDSGLLLNIGSHGTSSISSKRRFLGNRKQRIKARKREKLKAKNRIQSETTSGIKPENKESNTEDITNNPQPENVSSAQRKEKKLTTKRKYDEEDGATTKRKQFKSEDIHSTNNEAKPKHHKNEGNKKDSNKVFISSLFKFNPEIPQVKKLNIKGQKEAVFSTGSFADLELHPHLVSNLQERLKLSQMTQVQELAIPKILQSHDVLVKSQTGSGKTLSFAVPIIQMLQGKTPKVTRSDGTYAIIIVPTRELALQCIKTLQDLVYPFQWIVPGCLMGGERKKAEKARLRKGINILVSTPGRLIDHIENTATLSLNKVQWLVLDEADRMLDMGYEKDIAKILNFVNSTEGCPNKQTILLSATLSKGVERLAGISLKNPDRLDASLSDNSKTHTPSNATVPVTCVSEENFVVPEKLKQYFVITPCKLRLVSLAAFILLKCKICNKPGKMVVFLSTQDMVEFHYQLFQHFFGSDSNDNTKDEQNLEISKLHGDMSQKERSSVYREFCEAKAGVLLCTDVASRGLHLPRVSWIVQYTTPGLATEYIHRVGRTARAGKQGSSLLFLMPSEVEYIKTLQNHKISMEELQMSEILKTLQLAVRDMVSATELQRQPPRTYEEAATYLQLCFETHIAEDKSMHNLARNAYQSFVRGYATYPSSLKSIFHVKHLHLGHLAKSFGLREAPADIATISNFKHKKGDKMPGRRGDRIQKPWEVTRSNAQKKSSFSSLAVSEFSSGLEKTSKYVKKKKNKF